MFAEHLAQGGVQQVGSGVVTHDGAAPLQIHVGVHFVADLESTLAHRADMDMGLAALAGVFHVEAAAVAGQHAPVAHLAAGFRVERRALEHHHAGVAGVQALHRLAIPVQPLYLGLILVLLIAGEIGDRVDVEPVTVIVAEGAGARARWRCASISCSKPSMSTPRPRSRATSAVRSGGKPWVS